MVNNIQKNVEINIDALGSLEGIAKTSAAGYTWGSPVATLLESVPKGTKFDLILLSDIVFNHSQHEALLDSCLSFLSDPSPSASTSTSTNSPLSLPDVDLSPPNLSTPAVLCFYSHHRPTEKLIAADLGFLTMAKAKGWTVTRVWKDSAAGVSSHFASLVTRWGRWRLSVLMTLVEKPAFPEDGGDLCIRSTVHGWMFTR